MKIAFLLCLIILLTGCPKRDVRRLKFANDSPIIISDGSTHLRRKGANADLQISDDGTYVKAIVNDTGSTIGAGECNAYVVKCPDDFQKPLVAGWKLKVFDSGDTLVATVKWISTAEIDTQFAVGNLNISVDPTSDTAQGTDIGTPTNINSFSYAKFTNGGGSEETITCTDTGSQRCRLKIHYGY